MESSFGILTSGPNKEVNLLLFAAWYFVRGTRVGRITIANASDQVLNKEFELEDTIACRKFEDVKRVPLVRYRGRE